MQVRIFFQFKKRIFTNIIILGPPPLEKEKIAEIPKVEVTISQVEKEKLQCSVCWDDFILSEIVRKLPCTVTKFI